MFSHHNKPKADRRNMESECTVVTVKTPPSVLPDLKPKRRIAPMLIRYSLHRLPPEIMENVAQLLSLSDLVNLRLTFCRDMVSKITRAFAAKTLESIQFMFTPDSLHGLVNLSHHEDLGPNLKRLVFGTDLLTFNHDKNCKELVRPSNYDDMEYEISANAKFVDSEKKMGYSVGPGRRRFCTRCKSIVVLREEERCCPMCCEYCAYNLAVPHVGGKTISSTCYPTARALEPLLHQALLKLPNCTEITLMGANERCCENKRSFGCAMTGRRLGLLSKDSEPHSSMADSQYSRSCCKAQLRDEVYQASCLTRYIVAAIDSSCTLLKKLTLQGELSSFAYPMPRRKSLREAFSSLRVLEMTILDGIDSEFEEDFEACSSFIGCANGLEELSISVTDSEPWDALMKTTSVWPKVRSLKLDGYNKESDWWTCLRPFEHSLHELSITKNADVQYVGPSDGNFPSFPALRRLYFSDFEAEVCGFYFPDR
jgi:hypothetical protein